MTAVIKEENNKENDSNSAYRKWSLNYASKDLSAFFWMLIGQELVNQLKTVEKVQIERWKFKLIVNAPSTRSTMIFVQFRIMMNIW